MSAPTASADDYTPYFSYDWTVTMGNNGAVRNISCWVRGTNPHRNAHGGISTQGWVDCYYPTDADGYQNGFHWEKLEVRASLMQYKTDSGDIEQLETIVDDDETHNGYLPHVASPKLNFNACEPGQYRVVVDVDIDTYLRWGAGFRVGTSDQAVGPWINITC